MISKQISNALLKSLQSQGTNIFVANGQVAGQKAPHFMIHVIPRKEGDGLFALDTKIVDLDERKELFKKIEARFNQVMGIKKEVVEVEEKSKEPVEKEEVSEDPEKDTEDDSEEEPEAEAEDDEVEDESDTGAEEDDDTEEDAPETEDKKEPAKDDENASLDDIASLFK